MRWQRDLRGTPVGFEAARRLVVTAVAAASLASVSPVRAADGGTCSPHPVPNATSPVPAYKPYGQRPNACSAVQLAGFYAACIDGARSQTCQSWQNTNTGCNACIFTTSSAASWGPIIGVGAGDIPFNIGGCFGISLNEGASTTGCGAARWALDRCIRAACPVADCVADPKNPTAAEEAALAACRGAAADENAGACKEAIAQFRTKCAALDSDAGASAVEHNCPIGEGVPREQFVIAIGNAFCGSLSDGDALDGGGQSDAGGRAAEDSGAGESGAGGGAAGGASSAGCRVSGPRADLASVWLLFPVGALLFRLRRRWRRAR